MDTNKHEVCGLLIQDFRLPNLDQRMAAEQERLKGMAQELANIAVVDDFIIEDLKNAMLKKSITSSKLSTPFLVADSAPLRFWIWSDLTMGISQRGRLVIDLKVM